MRSDVFEIRAGWGIREEGAEACGARLGRMLGTLLGVHPAFAALVWTGTGRGVPTRNMQRLRELCLLEGLLDPQRAYDDAEKRWAFHGYRLTATANLDDDACLVLTVRVGRHLDHPPQARFANTVAVAISALGPLASGGMPFEALRPILMALIDAWEPEMAGIVSTFYGARSNRWGWPIPFYAGSCMIFLSRSLAQIVEAPASAVVEPMPGEGLLMRATDEPFDHENPQHVQVADSIQASLAPFETWCRGY